MKGISKAVKRTPHMVTTKVGMSKRSVDKDFDELNRNFGAIEVSTDKILKDAAQFCEQAKAMFNAGSEYADHFVALFSPVTGEFDLARQHPDSATTFENMASYQELMAELNVAVQPELELIQSRIIGPLKEFKEVVKAVRKSITKREHKLVDYDRHNNSLTKLREKKDKSLSDEKNLFKLEQDFEIATSEFDYTNSAMKQDLPRFLQLASRFIEPLYHSFFYMQLNIFYMVLEKLSSFAEGKYDVSLSFPDIASDFEAKRPDALRQIEDMAITKRIISTSRLVQSNRANTGSGGGSIGRTNTTSSTASSLTSRGMPPPSRSPSSTSSFKKPPPPPPGSFSKETPAPPPPYTVGNGVGTSSVIGKKPPPPPPLKPKPKTEPPKQYVVALYDFEAQADGDLSFRAGDRIEVVEKTASSEDWWTGKINGAQGVFPGNYVQDT
ncbi:BAR-domain-containing protein [Thelephora terrestris]|uniref:BAR-domain-containing protein n=1 Tax=Thelephora terrestris TaxID=56493 RepID=A0A9P6HFS8_9AGAM|nr:BAR-domain-containing protein [Thelephora terrestris]